MSPSDWTKPQPSEELLKAIGDVTVAWGGAHSILSLLFSVITRMDILVAEEIFYTLRSDASQRDITRAAAVAAIRDPVLRKQLTDAIDALGKLAGIRNAAQHTIWSYIPGGDDLTKPPPTIVGVRPHAKLDGENPTKQLNQLAEDTGKLIVSLAALYESIHSYNLERDKLAELAAQHENAQRADHPQSGDKTA